MAQTPLTKRLLLKPGYHAAIINAPSDYQDQLAPLPEGVKISNKLEGQYDFVQVFVTSKADVDRDTPAAMRAVKPGGLLWLVYPKKTSKIKTDIHRDVGWDTVTSAGWEGVALISIDNTWSSMRFVKRNA
jgi:hypothetical protein